MRFRSPMALLTTFVIGTVIIGVLAVCVVFGPAWIVGEAPVLSTAERLAAEIDMLASDEISVRHGGVHALEQLAELDDRY
jgi:hypothetical protein